MTQSIDNSEWVMQGVVRDPITGALLRVNADGSINVSGGAAGGGAGTGFTSATTAGTAVVGTLGTNGLNLGVPAFLTTADLSANSSKYAGTGFTSATTAGTAVVGTQNTAGLSLGVPAFLTTADLSQNSSLYAGTGFTGTGASGTLNSLGLAISIPLGATISSFEAFQAQASVNTALFNGASQSYAGAFQLPQRGSFSFLRMPLSLTTGSTTYGTTAATLNASAALYSTWNAVVYSLGTGASSRSLISVASGSAGFTWQNSMSVAVNGTQYSISQNFTYAVEGNSASSSSSYAISNTNYSFVSTLVTDQTGNRFLDINFATSLSAGPYWLMVGFSSSSATNSTGISLATQNNVSYSINYCGSNINQSPRIMGSTNSALANMGAGSFSTVGGGTTSILPLSALTILAGQPRMYFQMLRSA